MIIGIEGDSHFWKDYFSDSGVRDYRFLGEEILGFAREISVSSGIIFSFKRKDYLFLGDGIISFKERVFSVSWGWRESQFLGEAFLVSGGGTHSFEGKVVSVCSGGYLSFEDRRY